MKAFFLALALLFVSAPALAVTGTDAAPGQSCAVPHAVTMTANPSGQGGYVLTCEGGQWIAQITAATPTSGSQVATKSYVDSVSGDNLGNHIATTNLNMNNKKIYNLANPSAAADAATKDYVDNSIVNCGGTYYNGGCWYMSIKDESCMETCLARGGYVDKASDFDTDAECAALLDALDVPSASLQSVTGSGHLVGACAAGLSYTHTVSRSRYSGTFDPWETYYHHRVCSCAR